MARPPCHQLAESLAKLDLVLFDIVHAVARQRLLREDHHLTNVAQKPLRTKELGDSDRIAILPLGKDYCVESLPIDAVVQRTVLPKPSQHLGELLAEERFDVWISSRGCVEIPAVLL